MKFYLESLSWLKKIVQLTEYNSKSTYHLSWIWFLISLWHIPLERHFPLHIPWLLLLQNGQDESFPRSFRSDGGSALQRNVFYRQRAIEKACLCIYRLSTITENSSDKDGACHMYIHVPVVAKRSHTIPHCLFPSKCQFGIMLLVPSNSTERTKFKSFG